MTLWDEQAGRCDVGSDRPDGEMIAGDGADLPLRPTTGSRGSARPFWSLLLRHSRAFSERVRQVARHAMQGEPLIRELEPSGGVFAVGIPVIHRQRAVGAVVGLCLGREFFDQESLSRFCGRHQLDRLAIERLAARTPVLDFGHRVPPPGANPPDAVAGPSLSTSEHALAALRDVLLQHVEAFTEAVLSRRQISDLSSHLGEAYEELSLIYHVSTRMTVSNHPAEPFEQLSAELLESTVVESIATVIDLPLEKYGRERSATK
jgi:hypothetical protein